MTEHTPGRLTPAQIRRLLKPVRADRVEQKQGLSYVPHHEVRAELIRIFGPGNVDHTMHQPELLYEFDREGSGEDAAGKVKNPGKRYYVAAYLVGCTLRIRDYSGNPVAEYTEYHVEENSPLPNRGEAHAMAVTSAQSYALRRAALSLGDALGLHLYDLGSLAPLVGGTIQLDGDLDSPLADPDSPVNRTLRERQNPTQVNASTGEVTPPASGTTPERPATAPRARRAPAKAAAPAAPQNGAEPPAAAPGLDAAFKKPTPKAVAS